jgi:hypothetical protein
VFDSQQGHNVFLFSTASRPALGPTQLPLRWVPAVKRQGREAHYSPPTSDEVKNGGVVDPLLHTSSWRGAYWKLNTATVSGLLNLTCSLVYQFSSYGEAEFRIMKVTLLYREASAHSNCYWYNVRGKRYRPCFPCWHF